MENNKNNFILPDFENSNLNISATLAEFLGVPNKNKTIKILEDELKKNYKNIVFICFDGLGINPININLRKDSFLRKNIKQNLMSTFPSTTTNATTSLLTNKLPLEHGWFGWSLHFDNINKNINIFLNTDSWTNEKVEIKQSPLMDKDYYFYHTNTDYCINSIFPHFVEVKDKSKNNVYLTCDEFFNYIKNICNKKEKQFIYAYYPDPDSTMHVQGVTSFITKSVIEDIDRRMEELYNSTKDTLFIVTADHGQVDIDGYVEIYKDEEIMEMLEYYPFLEARAACFKLKKGMENKFEEVFTNKYGEDFVLFKSKELIEKGYFGNVGDKAFLLGDYIAIGTYTHKQMLLTPVGPKFKGHHTSLTEEMVVPLILINN